MIARLPACLAGLALLTTLQAYDTLPDLNPLPDATESRAAVGVWAEVDENAPSITLRFLFEGDFQIFRRLWGESDWGDALVASTGTVSSWIDTDVTVGTIYEYGISQYDAGNITGYLTAGIRADQAGDRGTLILVIAENIIAGNEDRLERLLADLVGDGWKIKTITAPYFANNSWSSLNNSSWGLHGHDAVRDIRDRIREIYYGDPDNVKLIYFLGHTPLAQSGTRVSHPDGHGSRGAYVTDFYFADVDGFWTDNLTNTESPAVGLELDLPNFKGDGIFDNTFMPSRLEMGFGRMTPFDSVRGNWYDPDPDRTHAEKMAVYLDKAHNYRHVIPYGMAGTETNPGRMAKVRWNPGGQDGAITDALELLAMFGPDQMEDFVRVQHLPDPVAPNTNIDIQYLVENGPYLYYAQNSTAPAQTDFGGNAVHRWSMQSWWGDWWAFENSRVSLFNENNMTLTWLYTGRFQDQFLNHALGIGEPFGIGMRLTANYEPAEYLRGGIITPGSERREFLRNLTGDPTLRLFPVPPVDNLTATPNGANVDLSWDPPGDVSELAEYRVYRSDDLLGEFTEIANGLSDTTYTDTNAPAGPKVYMVKAVHLIQTGSGTILQNAQGIFAEVGLSIDQHILPAFPIGEDVNFSFTASQANGQAVWSVASGMLPAGMELLGDGTLQGNPLTAGHYAIEIQVVDDGGVPVSRTYSLLVDAAFTEVLNMDLRQAGGLGVADKTQFERGVTTWGAPTPADDGYVFDGDDAIQIHDVGNDNWPDINFLPAVSGGHGFTFVASFKADPEGDGGMILAKGLNMDTSFQSNLNEYSLRLTDDGKVEAWTTQRRIISGTGHKDGNWHHIVYVLGTGTSQTKLFLNGVEIGTQSDGRRSIEEDLLIGARWDGDGTRMTEYFEGTIADVRIYRTGVTDGEAKALHERFTRSRNDITPVAPVITNLPDTLYLDGNAFYPTGSVAFNITDANGDPFKTVVVRHDDEKVRHAEIARTATGYELRVELTNGFQGSTDLTVAADDGWPGQTTSQRVSLKIVGAADDEVTALADMTDLDVIANDEVVPGSAYTLTNITQQPAQGYARIVNNRIRFYAPALWREPVTLTYEVTSQPDGLTSTAQVTISPSSLPAPMDDSYSVSSLDPVGFDVLANDTDPLNETLELIRVVQPLRGTARIVDGHIEYTPPGSPGPFSEFFIYYVRNASGFTQSAQVNIALNTFGSGEPLVDLRLDEASGTQADNAGTLSDDADGTVNGTVSWGTGLSGNALSFDGTSTYLSLGNPAELSFDPGGDSFSIIVSLLPDTGADFRDNHYTVISKETGPGSQTQFAVVLGDTPSNDSSSSDVIIYLGDQVIEGRTVAPAAHNYYERPDFWRYVDSDDNNNDADWRLLSVIYDAELDVLRVYVDNWLIARADTSGISLSQPDNGQPVLIGARPDGSGGTTDYFHGLMDNVVIYDRAISPLEIKPHLRTLGLPSDDIIPTSADGLIDPPTDTVLAVNEPRTLRALIEDPDTEINDLTIEWYVYSPGFNLQIFNGSEITLTPDITGTWVIIYYLSQPGQGSRRANSGSMNISVALNAVEVDRLAFTTDPQMPGIHAGAVASRMIGATGGTPPYTFTRVSGSLPEGLNLDPDAGEISGTATAEGLHVFTVRVADSDGEKAMETFKLRVRPPDTDADNLPDDWELIHLGDLSGTPDADIDGDGLKAKVEFVLADKANGIDPNLVRLRETRGTAVNNDDRYIVITYQRRSDMANFQLKLMQSTDFSIWTEVTLDETIIADDGEKQRVEVRVPRAGAPVAVYRIAVD